MEVTALCSRLVMNVLALLCAQVQHNAHKADANFPTVTPPRLQLFEYESVSINCKGAFKHWSEWRVMRNIRGTDTICNIRVEITGSCTIATAFSTDSGEYWCEAEGKKSKSVNIIVTAGPVILESPALPVKDGEDVTLQCRNKTTPSNFTTYFYKNGLLVGNSSTGQMIISNVSKSDEGRYKCNISGAGESPESRLVVGGTLHPDSHISILLWMVVSVLLAALLLFLVMACYCKKHKVSAEASVGDLQLQTNNVVRKHRKEKETSADEPQDTQAAVTEPRTKKGQSLTAQVVHTLNTGPGASSSTATPDPSSSINPLLMEDRCLYYTINEAI